MYFSYNYRYLGTYLFTCSAVFTIPLVEAEYFEDGMDEGSREEENKEDLLGRAGEVEVLTETADCQIDEDTDDAGDETYGQRFCDEHLFYSMR